MNYKDALLGLMDRLGAESWPHVDDTPLQIQDTLYEHITWLVEYEKKFLKYKIAKDLLDEIGDFSIVEKRNVSKRNRNS